MSGVDDQKAIGNASHKASRGEQEKERAAKEFSEDKKNQKLSMHVKVYSPFRDYFDGQAFSISAENETGPFDILPRHHNFISLLKACDLMIRTARAGEKKIIISGGVMHVKADQVIVFLDI